MKRVPSTSETPGDELDALLGSWFKAQMPAPWPAFEPPAQPSVVPFPRRKPEARGHRLASRFALAASVALLFVAGWLLAGRFASPVLLPDPVHGPGAASKPGLPPMPPMPPGHPAP